MCVQYLYKQIKIFPKLRKSQRKHILRKHFGSMSAPTSRLNSQVKKAIWELALAR